MSPWLFLLLLFLPPVLLVLLNNSNTRRSKLKLPPGPRPLPLIGNLHELGSDIAHRSLHKLSTLHGPIMHLTLGRIPTVVISSPSLAEQVLRTHDLALCYRPRLLAFHHYTYNASDLAAAPYGDHWRNLRKIFLDNLLSSTKTRSFTSVREAETNRMIQSIKARASDAANNVNIKDLLVRLTNNIVCRVALGIKDEGEYSERMRFQGLLEEAHSLMACFFVGEFFPGFGWIDRLTGRLGKLKRNAGKFDAFYQEVIDKHLNAQAQKEEAEEEDFVDVLLRLRREGQQLTMDSIKGALMNVFVGGTDTSASTVTWAMAELARNPDLMRKAQDEVRRVAGTKGRVEESDLPQMQYLKLVVKETLRLHSPGPLLLPREAMQHCQIGGYDITPKTRVLVNFWAIGRDKSAWENPEEFNPERFNGSSVDYKGHHFHFLPFGGGRRICPGLHFGIANVQLPLANLLYAFNWELPAGMKGEDIDMSESPGIAVTKKVPLQLMATINK